MELKRRVIMVGSTFFLAAATGHLMQNADTLMGSDQPGQFAPRILAEQRPAEMMMPTEITPLAGTTEVEAEAPVQMAQTGAPTRELDCAPVLSVERQPAAMVALSLTAPCHPNMRVALRHAGLAVTGLTSDGGAYAVSMPALSERATFEATLPDGAAARAEIAMPSIRDFDRVAVQWQGTDAFELHAFEFGAQYGEAGHVWAMHPRGPGFGQQAAGGFLTVLGNGSVTLPMRAEVYSFPSRQSQQQGVVELTIEARVTPDTCGRDMLGETIEARSGAPVKTRDLMLAMPACDAVGEYLVLKNLLSDVVIAGN